MKIAVLLSFLLTTPLFAVDGVIEINQARAEAGDVTAGDTAGFPVTISESGSYVLTSNLTVTDPAVVVLQVDADHVAIDFNGFKIEGPAVCSGNPVSCVPISSGAAIRSNRRDIRVVNGTIRNMTDHGLDATSSNEVFVENMLFLENARRAVNVANMAIIVRSRFRRNGDAAVYAATRCQVRDNAISDNAGAGVSVNGESVIAHNTLRDNSGGGIFASSASQILFNTVNDNGGDGINATSNSVVIGNSVGFNDGWGLNLSSNTGYAQNVMTANDSGNVTGGVQMGQNICSGSLCP